MTNIFQKLHPLLTSLKDPEIAAKQSKYLKYHFPFLGIRNPTLQKTAKTLFAEYPLQKDWQKEAMILWQQPEREFHYTALLWAMKHRKKATEEDLGFYEHLILTNSWWDTVDTIAPHLVGDLFLRFPNFVIKTEEWISSNQMWLQRAALLYQLRYKEKTDAHRLFDYCNQLSQEKEFFIRKAIGWALREYAKTEPEKVYTFVEKTPLSPLSKKEALKHYFQGGSIQPS